MIFYQSKKGEKKVLAFKLGDHRNDVYKSEDSSQKGDLQEKNHNFAKEQFEGCS